MAVFGEQLDKLADDATSRITADASSSVNACGVRTVTSSKQHANTDVATNQPSLIVNAISSTQNATTSLERLSMIILENMVIFPINT